MNYTSVLKIKETDVKDIYKVTIIYTYNLIEIKYEFLFFKKGDILFSGNNGYDIMYFKKGHLIHKFTNTPNTNLKISGKYIYDKN